MSDLDLMLDVLADANDKATEFEKQMGQFTNSGKIAVEMVYKTWDSSTGEVQEVSAEEYKAFSVERGKSNKWVAFDVSVDIQEFKPDLEFTYKRSVQFRHFDQWHNILEPSVAELLGLTGEGDTNAKKKADLAMKVAKALLEQVNGKYGFVNDTPGKPNKKGDIYKYPAITAVFNTRDEFIAAAKERFGESFGETAIDSKAEDCPSGFSSFDEFAGMVTALRADGTENKDIAEALDVSIKWVLRVK